MSRGLFCCITAIVVSVGANAFAQDETGFKPIFDGKSLNGWQGEEGRWEVKDGVIVGETTPEKPLDHNTFLLWDNGEVDDFELRLKFRISGSERANSGIQFRGDVREDGHVIGYQADIDRAGQWIGSLYDEATGRGPLAKRGHKSAINHKGEIKSEQVADPEKIFKENINIDDWNDYSISARDNHITLKINGIVTAEVIDDDPNGLDRSGVLALQLHTGPPMKIEFKDIRLKRFPLKNGYKKVVFVAGTPSHGYFSHEHNAGCKLLAKKLEEAGAPVVSAVYTNGWPKDVTAFDNADTVVSYCDGGGRHYLNNYLKEFDSLVEERGVGLVCIHYAVETTIGECGDHFLKWIGGYFEPNWSVNPHWDGKFDKFPEHSITNGVEPFEVNDEWYYHMRFQPEMKNVTPILTALPPRETLNRPDGAHSGNPYVRAAVMERKEPQHVAWAYERPDGKGRGFGFTGGHFHKNWGNDNFRKLVLNAILWSAHADVPASGVSSPTPSQEELEANQDYPKPGEKKEAKKNETKTKLSTGQGAKPKFSSEIITPKTPGHAVDIEVDITGAKQLFLVVTDGGNGYSCDWSDWADPVLIGEGGEKSLTELKWKSASSQWGDVNVGKNAGGGSLKIAGQAVKNGIGVHANSVIAYDLPQGHKFTKFKARGGLDNGGTDQAGGGATSVQFHVFTESPSPTFLANNNSGDTPANVSHEAADSVEQLKVHDALEATLFASEPMMSNPASIDIDHLGRVWVCEAINYRAFRNKDVIGDREEGDRILVLEDNNSDAKADVAKVFYQGHDVDSAHGILVLPDLEGKGVRALVSAGDSVFYLIDEDGDLKADKKDMLFTGIDGTQHDHGIHAFHFGPDGKLYFNFGNAGKRIKDKGGNPIIDKQGNEVNDSRKPYQEGMVFRCNMDGSEFETLGWNFRNNWEACVDSFGTIWQSDNDDDGNKGVRINYVMEFGNYGYKDEFTGAGWRDTRTNLETEIPLQHWHLNDPGVMPNLLQTGQGAPTGICIYEGELLPEIFRGQPIHCDAGPNICRAYITKPDGAGYTAEVVDILDGAVNKWFRPADVCVAPDGSILVADWYDPGVGGHRMQDAKRGRIFRVIPKGQELASKYSSPKVDVSTAAGAVAALSSPNMTARYLGFKALQKMGPSAEAEVITLWQDGKPHLRARALWMLGKLGLSPQQTQNHIIAGLQDGNNDIKVTAIRLARQMVDTIPPDSYKDLVTLDGIPVPLAREILIAIRDLKLEAEPLVWALLARMYDGNDRWYLEALGIAAEGQWDACLNALMAQDDFDINSKTARDIIWRSRGTQTPQLIATIIANPQTPAEELPRFFRALDFQNSSEKNAAILALAFESLNDSISEETVSLIRSEAINRVGDVDISQNKKYIASLNTALESSKGTAQFVKLVSKFKVADQYPALLELAKANPESQLGVDAIDALYDNNQYEIVSKPLWSQDRESVEKLLKALMTAADGRSNGPLLALIKDDERPTWARRSAISALAASVPGSQELLKIARQKDFQDDVKEALAAALNTSPAPKVREQAASIFPPPPGKDKTPLPPLSELIQMKGNVANGRIVFNTTGTCNKCHVVNGIGVDIGPDQSEVGKKLTKQALFESILYPSAGISHNYEMWLVQTLEGQVFNGLLVSDTGTELKLKDDKGIIRSIPNVNIDARKKMDISMMPADMQKLMTVQELVDVVEYLTTLKEKKQ